MISLQWERFVHQASHWLEVFKCFGFTIIMRTLADYPKLLLELHPKKNGVIEPKDYSYGSNKKLFWCCDAASDHVWEASVKERAVAIGRFTGRVVKVTPIRKRLLTGLKLLAARLATRQEAGAETSIQR